MFELLSRKIMEKGAAENQILLLNMEDFENAELLDAKKLYDFIKSKSEAAGGKKTLSFSGRDSGSHRLGKACEFALLFRHD